MERKKNTQQHDLTVPSDGTLNCGLSPLYSLYLDAILVGGCEVLKAFTHILILAQALWKCVADLIHSEVLYMAIS